VVAQGGAHADLVAGVQAVQPRGHFSGAHDRELEVVHPGRGRIDDEGRFADAEAGELSHLTGLETEGLHGFLVVEPDAKRLDVVRLLDRLQDGGHFRQIRIIRIGHGASPLAFGPGHGVLHDLADVHGNRAAFHAPAAAAAGDEPLVQGRIIAELVSHPVSQAMGLGGTGIVTRGLQGELEVHAGVPGPHPPTVQAGRFVGDGEAVAGRAQKRAGAAADALVGLGPPEVHVVEGGKQGRRCVGDVRCLAQGFPGGLFHRFGRLGLAGAVGEQRRVEQGLALFAYRLHGVAVADRG